VSEREKDPQAIDPPENTRADSEMRTDSTEEQAKASAIDPPENTKQRTE
jgi:hypothetical protein